MNAIRYILLTLDPKTTEYTERSLNLASLELLIVSGTLICELLSKYKKQLDSYDYPYLYMLQDIKYNNISNIIWNYLKAVKGRSDDTEILDFSNFKDNGNYTLARSIHTFATIPYRSLPFWGFKKNKIFIDCAEDMFWYQWEQYKNLYTSKNRISDNYTWMGLDPISYIIIERHDKRFDGYRVIGKKYIQQV